MSHPTKCRRGHELTKSNTRPQWNIRSDGTRQKSHICLECVAYRVKRRAKGLPIKDMRRV